MLRPEGEYFPPFMPSHVAERQTSVHELTQSRAFVGSNTIMSLATDSPVNTSALKSSSRWCGSICPHTSWVSAHDDKAPRKPLAKRRSHPAARLACSRGLARGRTSSVIAKRARTLQSRW